MSNSNTGHGVQSQIQRLARNGIALAAGGVVAQLAFTLLEILVARELGAEAYGVFVTAYACTVLAAFLMELGTPLWMIQEGSRDHSQLPKLLGSALTVNGTMFGVLYVLLATIVHIAAPNPVLAFLLILLPYGLVLTVQNTLASVYSSYQTMGVNALFQGLAPVVILLVYFLYARDTIALPEVGSAYVIGGGFITGIWVFVTLRKLRPSATLRHIRTTLRSSYQYGLTGILGQVYFKSDIILLTALAGLREAGIYAAAFKLVELVSKVAVLSSRVFAPVIFKASHESEDSFKLFASMMTRVLAIAGLLAGLVAFVVAEELILLMFGEAYAESIAVLQVLGGLMATRCMMVALQLLLSSIDLHFERVANLGFVVVVHVAANAVLIPMFGALGAAYAALLSSSVLVVAYARSSLRKRKFAYLQWLALPTALAALIGIMADIANIDGVLAATAAVGAFLIALLATGFVRRDEILFVFRAMLVNQTR